MKIWASGYVFSLSVRRCVCEYMRIMDGCNVNVNVEFNVTLHEQVRPLQRHLTVLTVTACHTLRVNGACRVDRQEVSRVSRPCVVHAVKIWVSGYVFRLSVCLCVRAYMRIWADE